MPSRRGFYESCGIGWLHAAALLASYRRRAPHPAIDPSGKMVATCDEHPPLVSGNVDGRLRGVSVV